MMEQPESIALARQLNHALPHKKVSAATMGASPHKFAFIEGDSALLQHKQFTTAKAQGPYLHLQFEDSSLLLRDGTNLRYYGASSKVPAKHQLLLQFTDGSALTCTVQMYGFISLFTGTPPQNPYYTAALTTLSALDEGFTQEYFLQLIGQAKPTLSAKALLATEQRIPGIGNGTLQDILFHARIHPQTKINAMTPAQQTQLWQATVQTMHQMAAQGGRDTEKDLYGQPGGYTTLLSNKTVKTPCPVCGEPIQKQTFLGGTVYFCPQCQPH